MNTKLQTIEAFGIANQSYIKEAFLVAKLLLPSDISRQLIVSPNGKIYKTHLDRLAKYTMLKDGELPAIISFQTREFSCDGLVITTRVAEIRKFVSKEEKEGDKNK